MKISNSVHVEKLFIFFSSKQRDHLLKHCVLPRKTTFQIFFLYRFVHMDDESCATEAVRNLNGHSVKGRPIKVEKSESKGPRKPSQKLFIGNIAEGTTNEELKGVFERFAEVLEADVIKNYGFVHIDANAGRQKVNEIIRELNGFNLNGSNIRVQMSTSGVRQKPGMGGDQCYR